MELLCTYYIIMTFMHAAASHQFFFKLKHHDKEKANSFGIEFNLFRNPGSTEAHGFYKLWNNYYEGFFLGVF